MWSSLLTNYTKDIQEFVATVTSDTSAVVKDVANTYVKPASNLYTEAPVPFEIQEEDTRIDISLLRNVRVLGIDCSNLS
jgi:hypothetical protein